MKKYIISVFILYIVCSLVACGAVASVSASDTINDAFSSAAESKKETSSLSSSENISSDHRSETTDSGLPSSSDLLNQYGNAYYSRLTIDDAPVDLSDLKAVTQVYVSPVNVNVFYYAWAAPSDITADNLIEICARNNFLDLPRDVENVYLPEYANAPADQVEAEIQRHFDVESDYLKTSQWYEYENIKNTYLLVGGFGGGFSARAISATQNGNQIMIEVGIYKDEDFSLTPSGTLTVELSEKNEVKYISYQINELFKQNELFRQKG